MKVHVADIPLTNQIVGQIKAGVAQGLGSVGMLIGEVSALSAISTRTALAHVADKPLAIPLRRAVEQINPFTGSSTLMEAGSVGQLYSAFSASANYGPSPY